MSEYTKDELMADPRTLGQMADAIEVEEGCAVAAEELQRLARETVRVEVPEDPAEELTLEEPEEDGGTMIFGGKANVFRW